MPVWNGQQLTTRAYQRALTEANARTDQHAKTYAPATPLAVSAEQLTDLLNAATERGLIYTWTPTGLDDDEQLIEVGILYSADAEWEYLTRPRASLPFLLRPNGRTTWRES